MCAAAIDESVISNACVCRPASDTLSAPPPPITSSSLFLCASAQDLFKVGTVGDAYMCVANVRCPLPDTHAAAMAQFAFGCGAIAKSEPVCLSRPELGNIRIRCAMQDGCHALTHALITML
eukprot:326040-Pelagomonas_calceolata.AAC.3